MVVLVSACQWHLSLFYRSHFRKVVLDFVWRRDVVQYLVSCLCMAQVSQNKSFCASLWPKFRMLLLWCHMLFSRFWVASFSMVCSLCSQWIHNEWLFWCYSEQRNEWWFLCADCQWHVRLFLHGHFKECLTGFSRSATVIHALEEKSRTIPKHNERSCVVRAYLHIYLEHRNLNLVEKVWNSWRDREKRKEREIVERPSLPWEYI